MSSISASKLKHNSSQMMLTEEQARLASEIYDEIVLELDDLGDETARAFSRTEFLFCCSILEELLSFYNNDLCCSYAQFEVDEILRHGSSDP